MKHETNLIVSTHTAHWALGGALLSWGLRSRTPGRTMAVGAGVVILGVKLAEVVHWLRAGVPESRPAPAIREVPQTGGYLRAAPPPNRWRENVHEMAGYHRHDDPAVYVTGGPHGPYHANPKERLRP